MSLVGARASSLPMQLGGLLVPGARWTSAVYCCGLLIGGVASWRQQSVRYAVHPSHGFYWPHCFYWPELLASRLQQLCRLSVATVWWVGVGCLILSSVQQVSPSGCLLASAGLWAFDLDPTFLVCLRWLHIDLWQVVCNKYSASGAGLAPVGGGRWRQVCCNCHLGAVTPSLRQAVDRVKVCVCCKYAALLFASVHSCCWESLVSAGVGSVRVWEGLFVVQGRTCVRLFMEA